MANSKKKLILFICIILFAGCDSQKEIQQKKEAQQRYQQLYRQATKPQRLYHQATKAWKMLQDEKAFSLLDELIANYPEATIANEAIKTRQNYEDEYAQRFTQQKIPSDARALWRSVAAYKTKFGQYPSELRYVVDFKSTDTGRPLSTISQEEKTWGSIVNKTQYIPAQGFEGFFFNQNTPENVFYRLHSLPKEQNNILYFKDFEKSFQNINSASFTEKDLGGYWVGYVDISKSGDYHFTVPLDGIESIFLDKRLVYGRGFYKKIYLPKGRYLFELQYANTGKYIHSRLEVNLNPVTQ